MLQQPGDICRYECFINNGRFWTYLVVEKGLEHPVQFSIEEWRVGNVGTTFYRVPEFERSFRILLQNAMEAMQRRISENMSLPARGRYINFIRHYRQFEQGLSLCRIASYFGIARNRLSVYESNCGWRVVKLHQSFFLTQIIGLHASRNSNLHYVIICKQNERDPAIAIYFFMKKNSCSTRIS